MTNPVDLIRREYLLPRRDLRRTLHDRAKVKEIHAAFTSAIRWWNGHGPAGRAGKFAHALDLLRSAGSKATTVVGAMVFIAGLRCRVCGRIAAAPLAKFRLRQHLNAAFCSTKCIVAETEIRRAEAYLKRYGPPLPKWFILPRRPLPGLPVIELPPPPPPPPKPPPPPLPLKSIPLPRPLRSVAVRPPRKVFLPTQEEIAAAVRKIRVDQLAASRGMKEAEAIAALAESNYQYKFTEPAGSEDYL